MWLAPQEIEDNSPGINNKTFVFYLPLSSPNSPYLLPTIQHLIPLYG